MSITTAIIIAGVAIGIGLAFGIASACYLFYKMFSLLIIAQSGDPTAMRRFLRAPAAPATEKIVPPMPEVGIEAIAENPEVMEKLRMKQNQDDSDGIY